MGIWYRALFTGIAIFAAVATADARMGGMGGRPSGGFHGFRGVHSRPLAFHFRGRNFGFFVPETRFGRAARFEGSVGGAYSGDVAAYDYDGGYDEDDDFAPEDLHFRVQDSFGPGDIGRPPPPPESYDNGPSEAARMDPWHGYEPDRW